MAISQGDFPWNEHLFYWQVDNPLIIRGHTDSLPYASGKSYRVIQGFDSRFSHSGVEQFAVDFRMAEGTPVHAAREGVVTHQRRWLVGIAGNDDATVGVYEEVVGHQGVGTQVERAAVGVGVVVLEDIGLAG